MQQGSSASALAARTAGMTDEQILDLDLDQLSVESAPQPSAAKDDLAILNDAGTPFAAGPLDGLFERREAPDSHDVRGDASSLSATTSAQNRSTPPGTSAAHVHSEPEWLKQLEAQPAAAAEARQWREAAQNVAALDEAYFNGDPGARSGLASRLYESDPAAFREMLAEGARMLSERDPQALAELARQLGVSDTAVANASARSLAQAARPQDANAAAQSPMATGNQSTAEFPTEAYRAFESATNDDVARSTRESIDRTLSSTLPEGIGEGARRRIAEDIFRELHATLSADRELSRQVGETLRGWHFDGATRQQVASLISSRARGAMPEVARRVVSEWTSSVLASDRARAARVDAAASRRDITGGRVPDTIPASGLLPRNIDYSRMTDEQILDL